MTDTPGTSVFWELAARGSNAWWRYLAAFVAACIIAIAIIAAGAFALVFLHVLDAKTVAELQSPTDAPAFFLGIAATFGALLLGFVAAIALLQRKRPGDLTGTWRWNLFFAGFGIWTFFELASAGADYVLAPHGFSLTASHATLVLAGFAALGLSVQTFTEEFIFRGYLTQGVLLALKRPVFASIVSGLVFGSLHIPNGGPQALNAALFGIVCSYIAIRTGGIALTFGVHLANNLFGAVAIVSADDVFRGSPGVLTQNTPHLLWWDTGVSTLALLVLALWVARRFPGPGSGTPLIPDASPGLTASGSV